MYPLTLSSVCCLVGPTLSTENPEFSQGMGDWMHLSTVTDRIMEMKKGTRAASNRNG